jgi:hypothetical protein
MVESMRSGLLTPLHPSRHTNSHRENLDYLSVFSSSSVMMGENVVVSAYQFSGNYL